MKDAFGRELSVGDQVAHCSRTGSFMDLTLLEVVSFGTRKAGWPELEVQTVRCKVLKAPNSWEDREKLRTYGESKYLVKLVPWVPPPLLGAALIPGGL